MLLKDWFTDQHLYYILLNEVYFYLGAEVMDSDGEDDWYALIQALYPD